MTNDLINSVTASNYIARAEAIESVIRDLQIKAANYRKVACDLLCNLPKTEIDEVR